MKKLGVNENILKDLKFLTRPLDESDINIDSETLDEALVGIDISEMESAFSETAWNKVKTACKFCY